MGPCWLSAARIVRFFILAEWEESLLAQSISSKKLSSLEDSSSGNGEVEGDDDDQLDEHEDVAPPPSMRNADNLARRDLLDWSSSACAATSAQETSTSSLRSLRRALRRSNSLESSRDIQDRSVSVRLWGSGEGVEGRQGTAVEDSSGAPLPLPAGSESGGNRMEGAEETTILE